jgi:hypothetical protein
MNSIPLAMAWDVWLRGRRALFYATASVVAVLVLLYRSLRYPGPWNLETENLLHYVVFRLAAVLFIMAICGAVGSARRYYTRPVSAVSLATCQLVLAMAMSAGLYLALAGGFNLATGSRWPLVGPALFCAAATAIGLAALWATAGMDLLRVVFMVGIGYGLLHWLALRTPSGSSSLSQTWRQLTGGETLSMVLAIAVSYVVAVAGIRLDRSSQLPWRQLPSLQELWLRVAGGLRLKSKARTFRSAWRAQIWREWREKGFVAPFIYFAYLVCVLVSYLAGWSSDDRFVVGVVSAGYWLVLLFAVLGMSFGKCGGTIRDPSCSASFAALPMSDKTLSHAMLRSALISLTTTWACWVATIILVSVFFAPIVGASSSVPNALVSLDDFTPPDTLAEAIISLLLALVAMWTVVGAAASVVMTGRGWFLALMYVGIVSLAVAYVVGTYWLEQYQQAWVIPWINAGLLAAAVLLTVAAFAAALVWRHLGRKDMLLATAAWLGILLLLEVGLHTPSGFQPLHLYGADFVFPFVALLPLFPLAAAPLALSWNRHR